MSSTAEELSSQAQQLQGTIAFFKVDEREALMHRRVVSQRLANARPVQVAHLAAGVKAQSRVAVPHKGLALNMGDGGKGNGGDHRDAEFEKF